MSRNILLLVHTHWDREWYFTKQETKVLLRNHMNDVFDLLENNSHITYILDGQSVMIDDYLELEPGNEKKLKKFIENKQLRVGPWYTQTDLLLVHGESVYRNLYYGIKRATEFGEPMLVGYAPDTFGHSNQMPQIYKQFNIDSTIFWRGFSELKSEFSDFIWQGADGTSIKGVNLATGYQGAKYLENNIDDLNTRMDKILKVLDKYSSSNARLVMNGHDQMPIQKDINEIVNMLKEIYPEDKIEISDFENYVNHLDPNKLDIVKGELNDSKHARIHRTIGSTRMDIKLLNYEIENNLFNLLEPLATICYQHGIEYPDRVIEKILKLLFGVHAHDSIGGCNSDKVNQDIKQRLINAKELLDTQIELLLRLISLSTGKSQDIIPVFNLEPERKKNKPVELEILTRTKGFKILDKFDKEIKYSVIKQNKEDAGLIDRQVAARLKDIEVFRTRIVLIIEEIDGLSIQQYKLIQTDKLSTNIPQNNNSNYIDNQYGKLFIEDDKIHYYSNVNKKEYRDFISIQSGEDAGDSYDYSPPVKDFIINSNEKQSIEYQIKEEQNFSQLQFKITFSVPKDNESRQARIQDQEVNFTGYFRMYPNDSKVYVNLHHNNKVKDNRYRLVFNTDINSDFVKVDGFLSSIKKEVENKIPLSVWEEENWAEKPVSTEIAQSFVTYKDDKSKFTVFTKGLKEYEVQENKIFITLFRTFGYLGKRNLVNRPGRPSGIEIPTPDNQLIDEEFNFNLAFDFNTREGYENKEAKDFLTPLIGYHLKEFNRFNINQRNNITLRESKLNLELDKVTISSIKLTEEGNTFIRLFNPSNAIEQLSVPENTYLSTALEEKISKVDNVVLKSQQIVNLTIERRNLDE